MQYKERNGLWTAMVYTESSKTAHKSLIVASSLESAKKMVANAIATSLKEGKAVKLPGATMSKCRDYSDFDEDQSETYTDYLNTSGIRQIQSRKKTHKNPKFIDNPECELCHKKVTERREMERKWVHDTVKVCRNCQQDVRMAQKIMGGN